MTPDDERSELASDESVSDELVGDEALRGEALSDESASAKSASGAESIGAESIGAEPIDAEPVDAERAIEAILMIADEPQRVVDLAAALDQPVRVIRQAIARLVNDYDGILAGPRRGFELREVGGGWRIYVRNEFERVAADFVNQQNPSKLSQAALETLSVIAYRQPITRSQVAAIRAVNVDSVVRTLAGRGLIVELFTDSETGAINYGTTDLLLQQLGINSLDELPAIAPLLDDGTNGFENDN